MSMVRCLDEVVEDLEKVVNLAKESPKANEFNYEIRVSEEYIKRLKETVKRIIGDVKA